MKNPCSLSALTVLMFATICTTTIAQDEIEFIPSIDEARQINEEIEAKDSKLTTVLYFGASWCKPCQQMKSVTFKSKRLAKQTAGKYQFVKFDVDDDVEIATQYAVSAVPTTVVLDANSMTPIGRIAGFVSDERMMEFLEETLASPQEPPPTVAELESALADPDEATAAAALESIIQQLANPQRQDRDQIIGIFKRQENDVVERLAAMLHDSRISIRAAACTAIEYRVGRQIGFDPFAESNARQVQIDAFEKTIEY